MGNKEVSRPDRRHAYARVVSCGILWTCGVLRFRESQLSDHSVPYAVCCRLQLYGADVDPARHASPMAKRSLIVILCLCASLFAAIAFAIEKEPLQEYNARRERLAQRIKGNVLVLRAAPDQELVKYQQERNFYYLTGFEEPNAILLLDAASDFPQEFLFLPERKPAEERWTGVKLGPGPEAAKVTGFSKVLPTAELDATLKRASERARAVYGLKEVQDDLAYLR